jgi:hypothetical protein
MKRVAGILAVAFGATALVVPAAVAGSDTHVKITSWHVYTTDGKLHKVKPGKTFKSCKSNPTHEIDAKGSVKHATKGAAFTENWTVGGKPDVSFNATWGKSGNFTDYFSRSNEGQLPRGKWKLKLVEGGKTIGKSGITLKTKNGC